MATVVDMVAGGMTADEIAAAYPDLEADDVQEALHYAAAAVCERDLPIAAGRGSWSTTRSPLVVGQLQAAGHDAVHAREHELQRATDEAIIARARGDGRVVLSADTDFGTLLALRRERTPSFLLFRRDTERRPDRQAALPLANLPAIERDGLQGPVVALAPQRVRVRGLPIGR